MWRKAPAKESVLVAVTEASIQVVHMQSVCQYNYTTYNRSQRTHLVFYLLKFSLGLSQLPLFGLKCLPDIG